MCYEDVAVTLNDDVDGNQNKILYFIVCYVDAQQFIGIGRI